jgi:hypothetical protein
MTSPTVGPNGLRGRQRPRICHAPEYVSSTGPEAIELSALAGLELDEWQQYVLTRALGERPDGKWAAQTVGLAVPRQNGKGSILEARELVGLFLLGERLINHTAHQQKTATNHYKRLLELIQSVPEFDRRVMNAPKGKGSEAIELRGGQTIFFATRSGGGGRGLTADLQVYDEAMYLSEQDRGSLAPTMAARSIEGNIQTWYAGSAVDEEDPAQDGVPFAQVRESGIAKAKGVAYFEWSVEGDDPDAVPADVRADPEAWAQANPGMGIRIAGDWIDHERTVELGARTFAVERLGVGAWPATDGSANRVITEEQWRPCAAEMGDDGLPVAKFVHPVALAYDVSPDRAWSSISAAGVNEDGVEMIELLDRRPGTEWVADRLFELKKAHKPVAIVGDEKGPAGSLIDEIEKKRLKVTKVTASEHAQACGMVYDAVDQQDIVHIDQAELNAAVAGAVKRPLGEAYAWSRINSLVDISPLVAATLALWGFRTKRKRRPRAINLAEVMAEQAEAVVS